eukprot:TRINITY_DN2629_c1_g1_i1.p1 TRINITY_DN2629_c1_g1~~TRINITY_DN2629_c1_g1_i1.p1  ORF type:complete len:486 (-),score=33.85 TRINITY_DN2629_c1_g1_i1:57-1514(-)
MEAGISVEKEFPDFAEYTDFIRAVIASFIRLLDRLQPWQVEQLTPVIGRFAHGSVSFDRAIVQLRRLLSKWQCPESRGVLETLYKGLSSIEGSILPPLSAQSPKKRNRSAHAESVVPPTPAPPLPWKRPPLIPGKRAKPVRWSEAETAKLIRLAIENLGRNWQYISDKFDGKKSAQQCWQRWKRVLLPREPIPWSAEEVQSLIALAKTFDGKWTKVAAELPGRTALQCEFEHALYTAASQYVLPEMKLHIAVNKYGFDWNKVGKILNAHALLCKLRWCAKHNEDPNSPLIATALYAGYDSSEDDSDEDSQDCFAEDDVAHVAAVVSAPARAKKDPVPRRTGPPTHADRAQTQAGEAKQRPAETAKQPIVKEPHDQRMQFLPSATNNVASATRDSLKSGLMTPAEAGPSARADRTQTQAAEAKQEPKTSKQPTAQREQQPAVIVIESDGTVRQMQEPRTNVAASSTRDTLKSILKMRTEAASRHVP